MPLFPEIQLRNPSRGPGALTTKPGGHSLAPHAAAHQAASALLDLGLGIVVLSACVTACRQTTVAAHAPARPEVCGQGVRGSAMADEGSGDADGRVASAVQQAAQEQDEKWGMMMDPAEIDVIAAFLNPSTVMLEWCALLLPAAAHTRTHDEPASAAASLAEPRGVVGLRGSGGSTMYWSKRVAKIYSVEHVPAWRDRA